MCWQLGDEQSLSVRELLLLSLNKQCLLAITYCKKAKAISVIFYRLILIGDFGDLLLLKQKR
jgi:hypothetical protein